jgi:HAD superfamily hydrolase (TIGR01459 family)
MVEPIEGLSELGGRYVALLCDVWGVIHGGREAFRGPCAALARWKADVGPVVLISNAARPSWAVLEQLDELGVPRAAYSRLVTSGDVTRGLLAERSPGPVYTIGRERDLPLYEGLGLQFADLADAAFICCTGPRDDDVETPEDYRALLERAAKLELPMICANPDKVVQRGDKLIYCGGALAELYQTLGGRVIMAGKPFAPIYEASLCEAEALVGAALGKHQVLAIGDGVATDLAGADAQGIDALFIAGGIHAAETLDPYGGLDPDAVRSLFAYAGGKARYAMAELAW